MSSYEWTRTQLATAGVGIATQNDVIRLLTVWESMTFSADDPRAEQVLSLFNDLVRGIAIEREPEPGFMWVDSTKAKPRQKDRVRIKRDAFTGAMGHDLNGKEGIIARISRGTLVMAIAGEGSVHVAPEKLETRVPVV